MSSVASSLPLQAQSRRTPFVLVGIGTVVAAVVANALFYFIASTVVAYDLEFLPLTDVSGAVIMTVGPAIGAVLLYAALRRFTRHPGADLHGHLRHRLRRDAHPGFHVLP